MGRHRKFNVDRFVDTFHGQGGLLRTFISPWGRRLHISTGKLDVAMFKEFLAQGDGENPNTIQLDAPSYHVTLRKNWRGKIKRWLLTGWKEEGGPGGLGGKPEPVQPTLSRPDMGAEPKQIIGAKGEGIKARIPPPSIPGGAAPGLEGAPGTTGPVGPGPEEGKPKIAKRRRAERRM